MLLSIKLRTPYKIHTQHTSLYSYIHIFSSFDIIPDLDYNNHTTKKFTLSSLLTSPTPYCYQKKKFISEKQISSSKIVNNLFFKTNLVGNLLKKNFHTLTPNQNQQEERFENNTTEMTKSVFKRLPSNVVPKHYNLELKPCLTSFTFDGKTSVKIQVSSIISLYIVVTICACLNRQT